MLHDEFGHISFCEVLFVGWNFFFKKKILENQDLGLGLRVFNGNGKVCVHCNMDFPSFPFFFPLGLARGNLSRMETGWELKGKWYTNCTVKWSGKGVYGGLRESVAISILRPVQPSPSALALYQHKHPEVFRKWESIWGGTGSYLASV